MTVLLMIPASRRQRQEDNKFSGSFSYGDAGGSLKCQHGLFTHAVAAAMAPFGNRN